MKISTKGRYAVRMLLDMAEHTNDGFISLKDIAERQGISKKYLEQIISLFNNTGILRSSRGFKGGYKLSRQPSEYTIGEILRITEGSIAPIACLDQKPNQCERQASCKTLFVWEGLRDVIAEYLDGITIQDIIDRNREYSGHDYVI